MARARSISLSSFTTTVQRAVKAAVEKHPALKVEHPTQLSLSYLIWGIPVPEALAAAVTVRETQAFAGEIASHLGRANLPGIDAGAQLPGAFYSNGPFLIVGIPALLDVLIEK